jgi:lysophospholipase L1-like esterase
MNGDFDRPRGLTLAVACLAALLAATPAPAGEPKDPVETFHVMRPFWASKTVYDEGLMFVQDDTARPAWARLLFRPAGKVALKSTDWKTTYREGKDFTVDRETGVLRLTPNSPIPFNTLKKLFPVGRVYWKKWRRGSDGKQCLLWTQYWGHSGVPTDPGFFARRQVRVGYERGEADWPGPVPALEKDKLARTLAKLRAGRPVTLAISGDEVVHRKGVSSREYRFPPYMPWYGDLIADTLERFYGSRVTLKAHPAGRVAEAVGRRKHPEQLAGDKPDLVLLAYGVGDLRHPHGADKVDVKKVAADFAKLLAGVRKHAADADVILLTPIPSHPEWDKTHPRHFAAFRDALAGMTFRGVALADATALANAVIKQKGYTPLAGDGVEVPGDYGHWLMAHAVCGLLLDPGREPAFRLDPWAMLKPPWAGKTVRGERVVFVKDKNGPPAATLMFAPTGKLHITALDRVTVFSEGKDYTVDRDKRRVTLTEKSRIPCFTRDELYPPAPTPGKRYWGQYNCLGTYRYGDRKLLFGYELFTARQCAATYERAGQWTDYTPQFAGQALARTMAKLQAGKPLRLTALGDSITVGGDASRFMNRPPMQPKYPDLVAAALRKTYGSKIAYTNISRGGAPAGWGVGQVAKVLKSDPDLVIVTFGMNDFHGRGATTYKKNIAAIIDGVRAKKPDAEFILVSSMWHIPQTRRPIINFLRFQRALKSLRGPGVALADVTELYDAMLTRKRWHDLGSMVNHPNDFGHRLYAQTILGLLIEDFGKLEGKKKQDD